MKRLKIFLYWLLGRNSNVGFFEVVGFVFTMPFHILGKRKEESLTKEGSYYKGKFDGFSKPIYWPEKFPVDTLYQVSAELLYKNWWNYEIPGTAVKPNDVVLDCGAAEGALALQLCDRCQKVYAIEPHPLFVSAMQKTFEGIRNIEIIPKAVGEAKGTLMLSNEGIMSSLGSTNGISVEVDTIDNLFLKQNIKVDYIKADLEGYEVTMLKGAEQTIRKWKPKLAITTYHAKDDYKNTYEFLKKICPEYNIKGIGITDQFGTPIMLHAWV